MIRILNINLTYLVTATCNETNLFNQRFKKCSTPEPKGMLGFMDKISINSNSAGVSVFFSDS